MVKVTEPLINVVKLKEPKQLAASGSAKRHVIGYSLAWCGYADTRITGEKAGPSQLCYLYGTR
jgi:hypothetical protein